jgi:hypothetical protein
MLTMEREGCTTPNEEAIEFFLSYLESFPERKCTPETYFLWRSNEKICANHLYNFYIVDGETVMATHHSKTVAEIPTESDVEFVTYGHVSGFETISTLRCPNCFNIFSGTGWELCACGYVICHCGNIYDGNAQCLCDL